MSTEHCARPLRTESSKCFNEAGASVCWCVYLFIYFKSMAPCASVFVPFKCLIVCCLGLFICNFEGSRGLRTDAFRMRWALGFEFCFRKPKFELGGRWGKLSVTKTIYMLFCN